MYVLLPGYSLLHLHLYLVLDKGNNDSEYLRRALSYVDRPLRHLKRKRVSFLCGDAGPLTLGAIIYTRLDQQDKVQECLKRYSDLYLFLNILITEMKSRKHGFH